jgi:hypothetical protein
MIKSQGMENYFVWIQQIFNSYSTNSSRIWADRVSGIPVLLYTQGLNSQTLLFGYFQYFSILFMFLSSFFRPIISSKIYIFNHFKF